jgi:hypothetical protein
MWPSGKKNRICIQKEKIGAVNKMKTRTVECRIVVLTSDLRIDVTVPGKAQNSQKVKHTRSHVNIFYRFATPSGVLGSILR